MIRLAASYVGWLAVGLALCLRFVGLEAIYEYAGQVRPYSILFKSDYMPHTDGSATVIVFGDSTSFSPPDKTADSGTKALHLPGMIQEYTSRHEESSHIEAYEWAFPAASMFQYYCMFFKATSYSPDLVIIPINWASFSPTWSDNPDFEHFEMSAFVPVRIGTKGVCPNPLRIQGIGLVKHLQHKISILALFPKGIKGWVLGKLKLERSNAGEQSASVTFIGRNIRAIASPAVEDLDERYLMRIKSTNPTFQFISSLACIVDQGEIEVLFYIFPLDHEYLEEIGIMDRAALSASKAMIMEAAETRNSRCADFSQLLGHEYFNDSGGHLTLAGRAKLAAEIGSLVTKRYASNASN